MERLEDQIRGLQTQKVGSPGHMCTCQMMYGVECATEGQNEF